MTERFVLKLQCPDTTGIVAAVTAFLASQNATLNDAAHFSDEDTGWSFMRAVFHDDDNGMPAQSALEAAFAPVAKKFQMTWSIHPEVSRCRTLIAVSKASHCLTSLLHRWSVGSLPIDVVGVVSNHPTLRRQADWFEVPFRQFDEDRSYDSQLLAAVEELEVDLVVLARYMRILAPATCEALASRCINIHHSFLPGFKGARPYHQAHARGVKLIGATAHYVTADLDEGPIIDQAVERVDHSYSPTEYANVGRDMESMVLNRAVLWHAEHRVFANENKTVVLRS